MFFLKKVLRSFPKVAQIIRYFLLSKMTCISGGVNLDFEQFVPCYFAKHHNFVRLTLPGGAKNSIQKFKNKDIPYLSLTSKFHQNTPTALGAGKWQCFIYGGCRDRSP
jgi:hypothetical protein